MKTRALEIPGTLVAIPLGRKKKPLVGFWSHGSKLRKRLLVYVHGMHSNFYSSELRKQFLREGPKHGCDVISFNNQGAGQGTNTERFRDCLADIDAVLKFAKRQGYRSFVLVGHSTGCQKITYYQALRQDKRVEGIVLLAIGDDCAITRRDLGRQYAKFIAKARRMVKRGKGDDLLGAPKIPPFSARRFLSIADPKETEAKMFAFDGKLQHFRKLKCPVLVVLAGSDEYETIRPQKAIAILDNAYRGGQFEGWIVRGADHGFHGDEAKVVKLVYR